MTHLLIVDDEPQFRATLTRSLKAQGHLASAIGDPFSLGATIGVHRPDVILLDLMFGSGADGLDICQQLRRWSAVPVIVISVRDDEATKVQALDAGADDYLVKPFGIEELLARIRAVQRRTAGLLNSGAPNIIFDKLVIDLDRGVVTIENHPLSLTDQEYGVLKLIAMAQGRVVTHAEIWKTIWKREDLKKYLSIRNVVKRLRTKLGEDPGNPRYIITEGTVGYRLGSTDW